MATRPHGWIATMLLFLLTAAIRFSRARSRSEELEQAQFFSHLITTFFPFTMYRLF